MRYNILSRGSFPDQKHIFICADDYGQNQAISKGIVHLLHQQRINATSCMVNDPIWTDVSDDLDALKSRNFIGLHLNLTHGRPQSRTWQMCYGDTLPSLPVLIKQSYLNQLDRDVLRAEIQAQFDTFIESLSSYPDFIDGHQHIHQLPIVREELLSICQSRSASLFIRSTARSWRDLWSLDGFPKRQAISLLGGLAFKGHLNRQQLASNSSFSGIYPFKSSCNYSYYFKRFLKYIDNGGLIMCHPGDLSKDMSDPLSAHRHHELRYFLSDEYLTDMRDNHCQLYKKDLL
jgi:hypothetical protein